MDLALKTNKEDGEDETPLFDKPPYLATASSYMETDEDDDDDDLGSSSFADNQYSNMNIPSHLKNILTLDRSSRMEVNLDDDSDSDAESTSLTQRAAAEAGIDLEKLNAEIDRNKFANFPLRPPTEDNEQEEEGGKTLKKTKKPREKKKRRDKGKKMATIDDDILFQADQAVKSKKLDSLFEKFAQDSASSGDEQTQKKSKKKSSSRKTRKKVSHEIQLDENGEQMMRTTDILDATSSESSEDERVLSKKQQMEMYREAERQRRTAKVVLKPVYNYKSFDTLVKRREEREQGVQHQEKVITHTAPPQPFTPPRPTATSRPVFNIELEGIDNDSDSDIEITGDPQKIARATQAAMLSPERPRVPVAISPVRHASTALRNHNRHMLYRITNEGYDYRVKMEQAAKARGQYLSATERARRLIEKEKNAMMINSQIERHFEKKQSLNNNNDDDNDGDEADGDYEEQEKKRTYNDDILDDLSGSEEEEFLVEEAVETPNRIQKRKMMSDEGPLDNNEGEEEEEDEEEHDMATMAFKRWKGKKVKKSTFFDDDDEEEEQISKKKKVAAKPMPAHSISNFFKAKENVATEQAAENDENKTLSRLVRRKDREPSVELPAAEDDTMKEDAMDIDNPTPAPIFVKKSTTTATTLKGPREKMEYLEEEAEEEDDEFFGAGGSDGETGENLDEFEKDDLLVEDGNEHIDEAALREAFNLQDKETDSNMIQRLITDITSGNLRKQKAALESGLMLDDIDLYDEEDNDLVAIRRAAAARRRRLLKKQGGDILENLMSDPKTAAFAKAAQAVSDEVAIAVFSESEGEEEAEAETNKEDDDANDYEKSTPSVYTKRVIVEDDEDEEDEDEEEEEDQEMKDVSDDENLLIVVSTLNVCAFGLGADHVEQDEFDTISSPLRGLPVTTPGAAGGLASSIHITSADDDDVDFQIENMKSPVSVRKAKPLYGSPGTLERFKRLIAETNNALNGTSSDTGGPRVGFGSMQPKQQQQGESEGKPKLTGSLGEIFSQSNAKESKLKKLKSQSSSLFKYAE
ncbi:hypothetical protein MAM1_0239d08563 [Mucor ambiguus]|uniref:DNA replication checkpoint mediator MRC1 domain-containing protein n=1 Tax=Mucor ambiguus TaxID=91626 RepID=A0A0C9MEB8_9FUNG|nr:hypothetical protein MAM1_0239d08563 [Mucor ambiguus]